MRQTRVLLALVSALFLCLRLYSQETSPTEQWDVEPKLIERVEPEYPPDAEREGVKGDVVLQVRIETNRSTTYLRALRPLYLCTAAAITAAEKWKWEPALKDGQAVAATGIITIGFPPDSQEKGVHQMHESVETSGTLCCRPTPGHAAHPAC
jgi:hypothetical protein